MSLITIIIPVYNAGKFFAEAIESVLKQTFTDWTLIIIDDGSTDSSLEIAARYSKQYPQITYYTQPNSGVAKSRNNGYEKISGNSRYVMFLDNDDCLLPDAVQKLLSVLDTDTEAPGSHGLAMKVDGSGKAIGEGTSVFQNYERKMLKGGVVQKCDPSDPTSRSVVVYDNVIPTPGAALLRREILSKMYQTDGFVFDPAYVPLDDWDFWLRVTAYGAVKYINEPVICWRRHEDAATNNTQAMCNAELKIRKDSVVKYGLAGDDLISATVRYKKLLKTSHRRASRMFFQQADQCIKQSKFIDGVTYQCRGFAEYMRYLLQV